jgi:sodium pump decarboxylase gamma subunit
MEEPTPNAINYTIVEKTRAEKYAEADKYGVIITITTMAIVFTVLLLLAIIFINTGRYFKRQASSRKQKKEIPSVQNAQRIPNTPNTDEFELAAIAMALHLYFDDQHEVEQTGFWLNRRLNQQTPWAAKHILFKKSPRRKK